VSARPELKIAVLDTTEEPQAVFFDLDGTVVDSNEFHVVAWARAFARHGLCVPRDVLRAQIGKGADVLLPDLFPYMDAKERDGLAESHGAIFTRDFLGLVEPFPCASELISRLHDAGIAIVLASSSAQDEVDRYADLLKITKLVRATVSKDDVRQSKPAPDIFALALEKVGLPPAAALVIGDTPYDAQAAAKCHIPALLLRSGGFSDAALRRAATRGIFVDIADVYVHYDSLFPASAKIAMT
jgi:HAD superfamily hydrolase (TIGR01509 family)